MSRRKVVQGAALRAMLGILNGSRSNGRYDVLSGAGHYQANGLQGSLWPLKDSLEAMVRDKVGREMKRLVLQTKDKTWGIDWMWKYRERGHQVDLVFFTRGRGVVLLFTKMKSVCVEGGLEGWSWVPCQHDGEMPKWIWKIDSWI